VGELIVTDLFHGPARVLRAERQKRAVEDNHI
jgi:hypothetical protein